MDGEINVSYNCLDRHVHNGKGNKIAIIWEGDSPNEVKKITYEELLKEVCRMSNLLLSLGLRKGDSVAIYLPNCPEAAVSMLACARLGIIHSVVFAGFSSESLSDRIKDAKSKVVITADEGIRGEKIIPLKRTVDEAIFHCPSVQNVLVLKKTGANVPFSAPRDIWLSEALPSMRPYCPAARLDSEDPLFLLYTSG